MDSLAPLVSELSSRLPGQVQEGAPFGAATTYGVGGPAAVLVTASAAQDVALTLSLVQRSGVPFTVVGGGSNLLVADSGFPGVVLKLGSAFSQVQVEVETARIVAGAAAPLSAVVRAARDNALTGIEWGVGIPGTVGGAVAMNAGSRTEWIGSLVASVDVVDSQSSSPSVTTLYAPDLQWGYRSSSLRPHHVVLSATLALAHGDPQKVSQTMSDLRNRRRATQPTGTRNAGSVFRNPAGDSAGRLIESAGLKGASVGGASVSDVHANFIVASEGATAHDVYALVRLVQERVQQSSGVQLETEIQFIGTF